MQLCIFEDHNFNNFYPLNLSRPVYELVCGLSTLKEKLLRNFPSVKYSLHCRKYLEEVIKEESHNIPVNEIWDEVCLFLNGSVIDWQSLENLELHKLDSDKLFINGDVVIAARISGNNLNKIKSNLPDTFKQEDFAGIPVENTEVKAARFIWDLIKYNGKEITEDIKWIISKSTSLRDNPHQGNIYEGVYTVGKKDIYIESGAVVKPGVVLDASNGPIFIDRDALVYPNAAIEGPVYIGEESRIKMGATIYENVSIGKVCKVGGEVEECIFMPYSNKQHAGFIGHAYIGSWVNLGADTNCSDLKNNYSPVTATIDDKKYETGLQFLGLIIGDHSKSAINTMFNTGTIAGFSSNIFGSGFPDKFIPSFAWGGGEEMTTYELAKALEVAKKVMARRKKTLTPAAEEMFNKIFELTSIERNRRGFPG
ncbi:MAG: GlmU family protein [Ignavibacteriaceae bacterium]|nr:GlmU family protein [Ignavibacteriaceae bacterium]